tara:strand:+ start:1857 stop:2693 length:837 start_codon:yes stop_codon:yes gene_type:complete
MQIKMVTHEQMPVFNFTRPVGSYNKVDYSRPRNTGGDGRIGFAPLPNDGKTSMMGPEYRANIKTLRGGAPVWNWDTRTESRDGRGGRSGLRDGRNQGVPAHEIPGYKPVTLDPDEFKLPQYNSVGPAFEPSAAVPTVVYSDGIQMETPPAFELVEDLPKAPNPAPSFNFNHNPYEYHPHPSGNPFIGGTVGFRNYDTDWDISERRKRDKSNRITPYSGKPPPYRPPSRRPSVKEVGVPVKRTLSELSTAASQRRRRRSRSRRSRRRSRSLRKRRRSRR